LGEEPPRILRRLATLLAKAMRNLFPDDGTSVVLQAVKNAF
jgi:hypothetical protein